jgi:predicted nucleic acid-binding protein
MFVLDTNVISELRKAGDGRADPKEIGVQRAERRDHAQGALLRAWLDGQVLPEFDGRVLPIDTTVAIRCARLHVPDPRADRDALIAATALAHGHEGGHQKRRGLSGYRRALGRSLAGS